MTRHRILIGLLPGDGWALKQSVKVYAEPALQVTEGDWQTVMHEPISNPMRFTLTHSLIAASGRDLGGGILGTDTLDELVTRIAATPTLAAIRNLIPWHLNDVRAGCAHQTVVYETEYGRPVPSLQHTKPCPVTGYRYGSAWLTQPLTAEIVELARSVGCVVPAGGTVFNE